METSRASNSIIYRVPTKATTLPTVNRCNGQSLVLAKVGTKWEVRSETAGTGICVHIPFRLSPIAPHPHARQTSLKTFNSPEDVGFAASFMSMRWCQWCSLDSYSVFQPPRWTRSQMHSECICGLIRAHDATSRPILKPL